MSLLIIIVVSFISGSFVFNGKASPTSAYYYRFIVGREGFTSVEINFNSTDAQGDSWVFVPKSNFASWNYSVTKGQIVRSEVVETDQVIGRSDPFYGAFKFSYQSTGFFNMTLRFTHNTAALIIEPRGIFYSSQIGFESHSNGKAEVFFDPSFKVNQDLALVVGANGNYPATKVQLSRVLFSLPENIVRLYIEFSINAEPDFTTLRSSDNKTFTFKSVTRYQTYARSVLKFYDGIYNNFTRLFNVTLDSVAVQWFLPDFESLLTVRGFVPIFTGEELGEINLNVAFIRAVNGHVEVSAAHELVHHFLGKAGLSPYSFLWFHEGMAQYISLNLVSDLGYEGAKDEKNNFENGAAQLIQLLGGENFGSISLQDWKPSYKPANVDEGSLYAASYYVVGRLPQIAHREGFDYYSRFFKLSRGTNNINVLALYLSMAANASVALTLQRWGFTVTDLYNSPVNQMIQEAGEAIEQVNPIFQPYRSLAEYFYQQALLSSERGDWERAKSLLQLSITLANLAPLLTFLTIIAILALLVLILNRLSKRPKPMVPPPPPEIVQPTA